MAYTSLLHSFANSLKLAAKLSSGSEAEAVEAGHSKAGAEKAIFAVREALAAALGDVEEEGGETRDTTIRLQAQKTGYALICPTCSDVMEIARWKDTFGYTMRRVHQHKDQCGA